MSGCANDCVAAIARADCSIIGTWRDTIIIDPEEVKKYAASGMNIQRVVCDKCPPRALEYDAEKQELTVSPEDCTRCMHCINMMPRAIQPGKERGATILLGGKATIVKSAFMSWVIVPFMKMEPPYDEFKDLIRRIWDWWDENGKTRERIGELIYRVGMTTFLKEVGLPAAPQMVFRPRANPYVFWQPEDFAEHK